MKDKMNWEETIQYIRTKPEYKNLVEKAYFEENLPLNVDRFRKSEEFLETLQLLKKYKPTAKSILDIGSGNGISAIALALEGYSVTTVEPDNSDTIGAEAIRKLKAYYSLLNLEIFEAYAEELKFPDNNFDIVYTRQCMHHAYNLEKFVAEASRVLKKNGLFISIRDHIVFDKNDKEWFLENHPLQKFYGGENAFTPSEYKGAMTKANLEIVLELKYYDSIINYFPLTRDVIENLLKVKKQNTIKILRSKIGILANIRILQKIVFKIKSINHKNIYDERKIYGRMYSYLCIKN